MADTHQLWQRYAAERSISIRQSLIEQYSPLVRYVVERLNLRTGPALEYDDLLSQAMVGLIDAIDRFDPARGIKFETYAYYRIRGAVMDMLRDLDWLPRSIRRREGELADAFARLEDQHRRSPTDEEVAYELGLTVDQLDTLTHEVALQAVQSLDESVGPQSHDASTLADVVADEAACLPEQEVERQSERELLASAIDSLPDSERTVISLYYQEGLTLKDVGAALGVTESRACQIHGKAILRLRASIKPCLAMPKTRRARPRLVLSDIPSIGRAL